MTPDRTLFEAELLSLSLPTALGEITVLSGHEPLTALLVPGIASAIDTQKHPRELAISGGFVQVERGGTLTVLVDDAVTGEELDLETIAAAKARAEQVMKEAAGKDEVAFAAAAAALNRELARERLAIRYKVRRRDPGAH